MSLVKSLKSKAVTPSVSSLLSLSSHLYPKSHHNWNRFRREGSHLRELSPRSVLLQRCGNSQGRDGSCPHCICCDHLIGIGYRIGNWFTPPEHLPSFKECKHFIFKITTDEFIGLKEVKIGKTISIVIALFKFYRWHNGR